MLADDDGPLDEFRFVEVTDVMRLVLRKSKLKHLVEVAIVELTVPIDRKCRPADLRGQRLIVSILVNKAHLEINQGPVSFTSSRDLLAELKEGTVSRCPETSR